ncbi:MAG: hypothetical protein DCO99_03530 [Synechococcus sp. XM-24]|nr:MAG: hypothetical protein DCO99_03530 [Synechococcus sp. XM-24]
MKSGNHFIPEKEVAEAIADLKDKGLDHLLPRASGIHYANFRAMWRRSPGRFIRCSAYAEAVGIGPGTARQLVRLLAKAEGCKAEPDRHDGRVIGLRLVPATGSLPQKERKVPRKAKADDSGSVRLTTPEASDRRLRERPIDQISRTPKGVRRDPLNQKDLDQKDLSPVAHAAGAASAPDFTNRGREKQVIEAALEAFAIQQAAHGKTFTVDQDKVHYLLQYACSNGLTLEQVTDRFANCLAWTATQHWLKGNAYPNPVWPTIKHHLSGGYPRKPTCEGNRPDCHAETLVDSAYFDDGFRVAFVEGYEEVVDWHPLSVPLSQWGMALEALLEPSDDVSVAA